MACEVMSAARRLRLLCGTIWFFGSRCGEVKFSSYKHALYAPDNSRGAKFYRVCGNEVISIGQHLEVVCNAMKKR